MRILPSHLEIAHYAFHKVIKKNAIVVDATCGNGQDSLYICQKFSIKKLFCFDIQHQAIINTKKLLTEKTELLPEVEYIHDCHSKLKEFILFPVDLIIYNLGYLPKGNKKITTESSTTLASLEQAIKQIKSSGLISITCYPGHEEGELEQKQVLAWVNSLDKKEFSVSYYTSSFEKAPCLILLAKRG